MPSRLAQAVNIPAPGDDAIPLAPADQRRDLALDVVRFLGVGGVDRQQVEGHLPRLAVAEEPQPGDVLPLPVAEENAGPRIGVFQVEEKLREPGVVDGDGGLPLLGLFAGPQGDPAAGKLLERHPVREARFPAPVGRAEHAHGAGVEVPGTERAVPRDAEPRPGWEGSHCGPPTANPRTIPPPST